MACYHPLTAYRSLDKLTPAGKPRIYWSPADASNAVPMLLPCGQCIGCRNDRAQQWALRMTHEAQLHEENCFITLTYDEEHLPYGHTLVKKHFQDFMKRLRRANPSDKIRFYHCGEYGETYARPHYHACLFGFDFDDRQLLSERKGIRTFTSSSLEKIWGKGYCTTQQMTFETASYVARYCMKKVNGEKAEEHYETIVPETGEIITRQCEYATMSNRPGLGKHWYERFHTDVYPSDFITNKGKKFPAPRYYDKLHENDDPESHGSIRQKRVERGYHNEENNTATRLQAREACHKARLSTLKRNLE